MKEVWLATLQRSLLGSLYFSAMDMDFMAFKEILETTTYLCTVGGVVAALYMYYRNERRSRQERDRATYDALDDKYIQWLHVCLEHPEFEIYIGSEVSDQRDVRPSSTELVLLENLVCLMERAYLMRHTKPIAMDIMQWKGWNLFIDSWAGDPKFVHAWASSLGTQYHAGFMHFMKQAIEANRQKTEATNLLEMAVPVEPGSADR